MDVTVSDPLVGRVLDGRYEVHHRIARGGMATVYLASDHRLDREVALKVMHPHLADDDAFVTRFIREARSAARLSHPNVVAVYDQGTDLGVGPDGESAGRQPTTFLAMEHVPGRTLREVLAERGALSPRQALDIVEQVLDALSAAHAAGLVHRDVKPENVLLTDTGRVKVADFGLARAASTATGGTATGVLIGTVAYLAPELVMHGGSDPRSDVYATGIMLYELLTGHQPYEGDVPIQVAYRHVNDDVPPPSRLVPSLPQEIDDLVLAATARNPAERPADAGELLAAVRRTRALLPAAVLDDQPGSAASRPAPGATLVVDRAEPVPVVPAPESVRGAGSSGVLPRTLAVHDTDETPMTQTWNGGRRGHRGRLAVVLLLVLALVGGGATWYLTAGPGAWTTTPKQLVGLTQADAVRSLAAAGLHAAVGRPAYSETVTPGAVAVTDPNPGARVRKGGTVTLHLSRGPERIAVPDLAGKTEPEAKAALKAAGLAVGDVSHDYSDTVPAGQVSAQDPPADQQVRRNDAVALTISKGPAPVQLDDWTNKPFADAKASLEQAGLKVTATQQDSETVAKDSIISQNPAPGTVHRGDTVSFVVSSGPPMVTLPNVRGKNIGDATAILKALGFQVKRVDKPSMFGILLGIVQDQNPQPGQAPKGSTITLTVF